MIAAELLDEANQTHMVIEELLPLGWVLERHLQRTTVGDGDELDTDLVDLLLQFGRLVEIGREVVDERFHVVVSDLVGFAKGEKDILFPSAACIGGDADTVTRLRRGRYA